MNISSVFIAVFRRWYISGIVLLAFAYLSTQLWEQAEPEYSSSTVLSVVPTQEYLLVQQSRTRDNLVTVTNPYGSGAATLASLLADGISHDAIVKTPGAAEAEYQVTTNPTRAESFFTVTVSAPTSAGVTEALTALEAQAPAVLADLQLRAGAPANQLFTAIPARVPAPPVVGYPDRVRIVLGTVLAGLLATALISVAADSAMLAARSRAREAQERRALARASA